MRVFSLLIATMIGISSFGMTVTNIPVQAFENVQTTVGIDPDYSPESDCDYDHYEDIHKVYMDRILKNLPVVDGKKMRIGTKTTTYVDSKGRTVYHPGKVSQSEINKGYVYDVNEDYVIVDGAKISTDGKTLLAIPFNEKEYTVPEGIETLNMSAIFEWGNIDFDYACSDGDKNIPLKKLVLPKSLKKICCDEADYFEFHCDIALNSLTLKGKKLSVKMMSEMLEYFKNVKASRKKKKKSVGKYKNGMFIYKKYVVRYSGKKKKVVIPKGTKGIAPYAFTVFNMTSQEDDDYNFSDYYKGNCFMKTLVIPKSVKTIGKYAFLNCWNLKTVKKAKGCALNKIGKKAFKGTKVHVKIMKR